ncbi:MAG: 50S ribosomal protein L4 [Clostridiales bacterium]|nr:50S ribosomal protein L4 [Clostridiales bacterium]
MASTKVLNILGQECGTMKLNDAVFKEEYKEALIHQVVVAHLANLRQGTKSTLTRSEVRGHAKKPWRQKGTGRARQGSTKAPQWRGGGVAFAPKPRDFSKKVNKEAKRVAFRSAISTKLAEKELIVLENLDIKDAKTKTMIEVMKNLSLEKTAVFVTAGRNENVVRASGNIPGVEVTSSDLLNVYDIVKCDRLVVTADAIKSIEEAYKA